MRKAFIGFICCLLCVKAVALEARVTQIVDGDTFIGDVLLSDDITIKSIGVRIRNVDTPELHGLCESEIERAEKAKERLSELIPVSSIVKIDNVKNDKYPGRIDANVYDLKKRDVGLILVREKIGRPYSGEKRKSWCK